MPGHWERDLIRGKANASFVDTCGYLMLMKMNDTTATICDGGFSAVLNRMTLAMRKSMTYDQVGRWRSTSKSPRGPEWRSIFVTRTALAARQ